MTVADFAIISVDFVANERRGCCHCNPPTEVVVADEYVTVVL